MSESKPYASLSSGLLARKGGAKPAMRPQAFTNFGGQIEDLGWNDMGGPEIETYDHVPSSISALTPAPNGRSPLDESDAPVSPDFEPEAPFVGEPPVVEQQRALEESFGPAEIDPEPEPEPETQPEWAASEPEPILPAAKAQRPRKSAAIVPLPKRNAPAAKSKAAFTLRLDAERHLRLRLACAVTRNSAQQLVTQALDEFLTSLPEVEELAGRVPSAGKR